MTDRKNMENIFAGMVCFPEFKKSVGTFGNVDQPHRITELALAIRIRSVTQAVTEEIE